MLGRIQSRAGPQVGRACFKALSGVGAAVGLEAGEGSKQKRQDPAFKGEPTLSNGSHGVGRHLEIRPIRPGPCDSCSDMWHHREKGTPPFLLCEAVQSSAERPRVDRTTEKRCLLLIFKINN